MRRKSGVVKGSVAGWVGLKERERSDINGLRRNGNLFRFLFVIKLGTRFIPVPPGGNGGESSPRNHRMRITHYFENMGSRSHPE